MSGALRKRMTLEAFLAWENHQETRHEFDGFGPVAMTGGSFEHSLIQSNLLAAVGLRLRGRACRVHGSDMKIEVAGRVRYPDALVVCSSYPRGALVVHDPVVVFEIISPSTAGIDRIVKAAEYFATPSIQSYVILEQDLKGASVYRRAEPHWSVELVPEAGAIALPEIGIEVPMSEIYDQVEMPQAG